MKTSIIIGFAHKSHQKQFNTQQNVNRKYLFGQIRNDLFVSRYKSYSHHFFFIEYS